MLNKSKILLQRLAHVRWLVRACLPWVLIFFPIILLMSGVVIWVPGGFSSLLSFVGHPIVVYLIILVFVLGFLASVFALYQHTSNQLHFLRWRNALRQDKAVGLTPAPRWVVEIYALAKQGASLPDTPQRIDLEVRRLRDSYLSRLQFPNFMAGSLVGIGLIGTFIGLLSALDELSMLFGSMAVSGDSAAESLAGLSTLMEQLQKPMKGMGTAFVTSLYGLVGSLLLALAVMLVNREICKFWEELASGVRAVAAHASNIKGAVEQHADSKLTVKDSDTIAVDGVSLQQFIDSLSRREKRFDEFMMRLAETNSEASQRTADGSQKLLDQFVQLQAEQNANVLLLSRQLKHQQLTLVDNIDKLGKHYSAPDKLIETLVIHSNALTSEVARLVHAVDELSKFSMERSVKTGCDEAASGSSVSATTKVPSFFSDQFEKFFFKKAEKSKRSAPEDLFQTIEDQIKALDQMAAASRSFGKN